MSEHQNVQRLRQGYEAFSRGDLDTIRELLAPDIVWHSGGDNMLTGDYKGIDDVFGLFGRLFEHTQGTFQQEIHDLLANDEHAVALTHATAQRADGRTLDVNQVGVYHMNAEGKVAEAWLTPMDANAADEFFS